MTTTIPSDVLVDVFSFLRVGEILGTCTLVTKRFKDAATRRDKLWRYLCLRDGHASYVLRHGRRIAIFFDGVSAQMDRTGNTTSTSSTVMADALGQSAKAHRAQLAEASSILSSFVEPLLTLELDAQRAATPFCCDRSLPRDLPDGHTWYHNDDDRQIDESSDNEQPSVARVAPSNDMGAAITQWRIGSTDDERVRKSPSSSPPQQQPLLQPLTAESYRVIVEVMQRAGVEAPPRQGEEDSSVHSTTSCAYLNTYRRFVRMGASRPSDAEDEILSVSTDEANALVQKTLTGKTQVCPFGVHPYWSASTGAMPPNPSWTPFKTMETIWRTIEDFLIAKAHIYLYCSFLLGGLSNKGILHGLPTRPKMDAGLVAMYMCCGGQSVPGSVFTEALLVALSEAATLKRALAIFGVPSLNIKPFVGGSSRESSGLFGHYERAADSSTSLMTMHALVGLPTATDEGQLLFVFAASTIHPKSPQFTVALEGIPGHVPEGAVYYSGNPRSPVPAGLTIVAPNIETYMHNFMMDLCHRRRFEICPYGLINRFPAYGFSGAHMVTTTVSPAGIEVTASATPVILSMYQCMFVYRVSMRLLPTSPHTQVKLLMRHWVLRNEGGSIIDQVQGDAVVGDYPTLTRLSPEEYEGRANIGRALTEQVRDFGGGCGGKQHQEISRSTPSSLSSTQEYTYCSRTVFMAHASPSDSRKGAAGLHQQSWLMGGTFTYVSFTDGEPAISAAEAQSTITERPDLSRSHTLVEGKVGDFMCRVGAFEDQLLYGELL